MVSAIYAVMRRTPEALLTGAIIRGMDISEEEVGVLRIEGVRVQNKSWGGWWGILRVAASSNPSIERTLQRPLRALWPAAHVKR